MFFLFFIEPESEEEQIVYETEVSLNVDVFWNGIEAVCKTLN